jgi:hypothetical protein
MIRSVYFRRIFPAAVGGMLFLIMTGLWLTGAHGPYFAFLHALGVQAFRFPFLDTHAVLAAVECHRMGIDVYTVNPCDVLGRLHVYSPLWLHLSVLPISTTWTGPVGFLLDVAFLMALAMLPAARGPMGVLVVTVAVASPAVAYALERGNNDLAMFLFALAAGRLAMRGPRLRLLGHALGVLAAALKFYPVMVLTLACRERWPRGLTILVAAGAVLAACLLADKGDLVRGLRLVPSGYYDAFGASVLPFGLTVGLGWPAWSRVLMQLALNVTMALAAIRGSYQLQPRLMLLSTAEQVFLTVGAALIVGCFMVGTSADYRAVHLLFTLPALLTLAAQTKGHLARIAVTSVLWAMWGDPFRMVPGTPLAVLWIAYQIAWWVLVTLLLASLLALLRDSLAMKSWLAPAGRPSGSR